MQAEQDGVHLAHQQGGNRRGAERRVLQAAAANADWVHADSYYLILTDQAGAKSWPITGASFILVYKHPEDAASVGAALKFFAWAYQDGASMAAELDYVPLPAALIAQVKKTWVSEITSGGHPVWSGNSGAKLTPWRSSIRGTPQSS